MNATTLLWERPTWLVDYAFACHHDGIATYLLENGARYDPTFTRACHRMDIVARFEARVRQAASILLSKRFRMQLGVPRDVAGLVVSAVWRTRRQECWDL